MMFFQPLVQYKNDFSRACCQLYRKEKNEYLTRFDLLFANALTHYQMTNFRLFQTERVCRRQLQFDETGEKLSKRIENTVGKGEIAPYEQFLLFPQCFQKACFPGASKVSLCGNGLNFVQ